MDRLALHISAPDDVALRLHELLHGAVAGTLVKSDGTPEEQLAALWRGSASVQALGYSAHEALLPESLRAFSGYRLLQETAVLPQRLLFLELDDLAQRLARIESDEVELIVFLRRGDAALEALVDTASFSLFCTPAINLFRKRLDPIQIGTGAWEYHAVPDRVRPMDYEVHSIASVTGFGTGASRSRTSSRCTPPTRRRAARPRRGRGYYTVRREPRLLSTGRSSRARARPTSARRCTCRSSTRGMRRTARTAAAVGDGLGHQPRPAGAAAARGTETAASGDETPAWRLESPGRCSGSTCCAADAAGPAGAGGRAGLEPRQPPDLEHLSLVGRDAAAARRVAAHDARAVRAARGPGWAARSKGVRRCGCARSCAGCRSRGR
jgi:hypothetical protein